MKSLAQCIFIAGFFAAGAQAYGQAAPGPKEIAKAKALQVEGLKQLEKGKAADALESFNEAYALVPSPKILFNQGRAHEAMGNDLQALRAFETFLAAPNMPEPAREDATRRLEKLRSRLAFLAVTGPAGATVLLDGKAEGSLPLDAALAVIPGTHELRLQRDNGEIHRQSFEARPGATIKVHVVIESRTIVREAAPPPPPPPSVAQSTPAPQRAADAPNSSASWMRPTAWVLGGATVAALVFGGVQQMRSSSKIDEFNDYRMAPNTGDGKCGKAAPDLGGGDCRSLLEQSERAGDIALGAFIGAGVLAAGATTLFILSSSSESPSQDTALAWQCGLNLVQPGATCGGRF